MTQARLGCDQHTIGTDRRPRSLKLGANFAGLLGASGSNGQGVTFSAKKAVRIAVFSCALALLAIP
jgi:hypothetical protein